MYLFPKKKKRIYLDYAAATPLRKDVADVMRPYERVHFANPSAIHSEGVFVRNTIEEARLRLARLLKIRPAGVVFTGSGTESNNLAIIGLARYRYDQGCPYDEMEVVSTRIEHPSVLKSLEYLQGLGVTVRYVDVNDQGLIVAESLQKALSTKTILVTFAYANSEVGVIQNVGKLARTVRSFAKEHEIDIAIHLDVAQAPLWLPCEIDRLHVDMMTLDAGKCYGPKGVGVLAMRHGIKISPVLYGGPQERGLRPATENIPGIIGAAEALCIAQNTFKQRSKQVTALRDRAIDTLLQIEGVILNGSKEYRIANNINISIPGIDSEFAVVSLDVAGVACSTKSACSSTEGGGSTVVQEITNDKARASSTIRFSLGESTTQKEIDIAIDILKRHIYKMREVSKFDKN